MLSEKSLKRIEEKKKTLTDEAKREMLRAGGSVKTKYDIDAHAICRESRGKS